MVAARGVRRAVRAGMDVLEEQHYAALRGKRIGLITNQTGVDRDGRTDVELLARAPGVTLVTLFSPEHGLVGGADARVGSSSDSATGLPVYSLYGDTLRPTEAMLQGIDALVFDIQDAGVRFYTYITTMAYCMEEAAKRHIPFFVLDRPNPLGGEILEGPMLDADRLGFTGYFPMPVRYGMTIGELAQMFNEEDHIGCDLHVIAMKGWKRSYFYQDTGLRWIPPSPNLRTLNGAVLYPGLEILQNAGVSVGRGTEAPFEEIGAPWIEAETLAREVARRNLPGVRVKPAQFIPITGPHAGKVCRGVVFRVTNRRAVRSMQNGLEIALVLKKLYPQQFDAAKLLLLLGNAAAISCIEEGKSAGEIVAGWDRDLKTFQQTRGKYLLYR
jgi:uncharacterized protein YbbC (DUF1343 family)